MAKEWAQLTPAEKKGQRFEAWRNPPQVKFSSPETEQKFKKRVERFIAAYQVQEPDRVPVSLNIGATPAYLAGSDLHTVMYDYEKAKSIWTKFNQDYDMDTLASPGMVLQGRVYDLLDYKLYSWPGHGLSKAANGIQFQEGEYMMADEYDALMRNPSDWWQRVYMPRVFGAFESFKYLQPLTNIIELPAGHFMPYSRPDVQKSLRTLIEIGNELSKWMTVTAEFGKWAVAAGYPMGRGGMAKAPFDTIGDTLRGTKGIISDMYRQPEKLLEGLEVITDITINQTLASANASKAYMVMFPLHKGADGFMSQKQFEKFYWPTLKKVILALVQEGIIPMLFAEGSYDSRLESVNEFSKGDVTWLFDKTDMARAKKVLGSTCCISGNIPSSMLIAAKPQEVKEYCRKLIKTCAPGGGFILSAGAGVDNAQPDNIRAVMEAAKEYGVY